MTAAATILRTDMLGNFLEDRADDPAEFATDPLALSWASYDRFQSHGTRWADLDLMTATEACHEQARLTRSYYLGRYALQVLAKGRCSEYQRKTYEFLNTGHILRRDIGLIYKLPYFYQEDQALDQLAQHADLREPSEVTRSIYPWHATHRLTPFGTILESRQAGENTLYLWVTENQELVLWRVKQSNPLLTMVQDLFERESIRITGAYCRTSQQRVTGTLHFYNLVRPMLA
jgi:hypothetical protein